jgi:SanA protein
MRKIIRKVFKTGILAAIVISILTIILNFYIHQYSREYIYSSIKDIPFAYTGLVPGSLVFSDSSLSPIVKDRVDKAIELYKACKIKRFLLSGDHGTKKYDEVNCMKKYMKDKGIPEEDIFLDHAGFDTYSSIVRADKVFKIKDMIIVSQEFHLSRALYIARKKGLTTYGFVADKQTYSGIRSMKMREYLANIKAFFSVLFNISPHFLGPEIPITGDSSKSYD